MTGIADAPPLFDLLQGRLGWVDARQRVLAQNIANADTPAYRPRDIAPFAASLGQFDIEPVRSHPLHLAALRTANTGGYAARPAEIAPDGNGVGLEDQLTKVADDEGTQALTSNLWKTYMGMFMTALGHG